MFTDLSEDKSEHKLIIEVRRFTELIEQTTEHQGTIEGKGDER